MKIQEYALTTPTNDVDFVAADPDDSNIVKRYRMGHSTNHNYIINGNFDVWQRGASFTSSEYTADRWYQLISSGTHTLTQITSPSLSGSKNCIRVTCNTDGASYIRQPIETKEVKKLIGKQITLSAYIRASVSVGVGFGGGTSTNVDDGPTNGDTFFTSLSVTTSWQRFSITTTLADTVNSIHVGVWWALTAGQWIEIAQVQLNEGTVALPFEQEDYGTTLAKCQRYLQVFGGGDAYQYTGIAAFGAGTTNVDSSGITLSPRMRSAPSLTVFGSFEISDGANPAIPLTTFSADRSTNESIGFNLSCSGGGVTIYRPYKVRTSNDTTARLIFSAEL